MIWAVGVWAIGLLPAIGLVLTFVDHRPRTALTNRAGVACLLWPLTLAALAAWHLATAGHRRAQWSTPNR